MFESIAAVYPSIVINNLGYNEHSFYLNPYQKLQLKMIFKKVNRVNV